MWMMLDDKRSLPSDQIDIIARSSQAAMEILLGMGHRITGLVIDYDLSEKEIIHGTKGNLTREVTGHDVLMFAIVNNVLPLTVQIIEDKPEGRKRLHNTLIQDAGYVMKTICSHGKNRVTYVQPDEDERVT